MSKACQDEKTLMNFMFYSLPIGEDGRLSLETSAVVVADGADITLISKASKE